MGFKIDAKVEIEKGKIEIVNKHFHGQIRELEWRFVMGLAASACVTRVCVKKIINHFSVPFYVVFNSP